MPISGAPPHTVPSAVVPPCGGNAISPTTAMPDVHDDDCADPGEEALGQLHARLARLLGEVRDGPRPVQASIASGTAKAIWCQDGESPSDTPRVSASGDHRRARPSTTSSSLGEEVDRGDAEPGRVRSAPPCETRDADRRAIAPSATTLSHGPDSRLSTPIAAPR